MGHRYRKFYKKKKKRKLIFLMLKSRFFWLSLLVLAVGGVLFYFSVFSSFFQIKEIKVSGNEKVAADDIRNAVSSNIGRRIVFFDTKSVFLADFKKAEEVLLKSFPQISQVKLERKLPNIILVRVEERKPVAVFCQNNDCFLIGKKGIIFEKALEPHSGLEISQASQTAELNLGARAVEEGKMGQILEIKSKIEDNFGISLKKILILSDTRLNVETEEDWEIYFNPEKDLGWQITELSAILKKELSADKRKNLKYIDLRFNKVYIFPKVF
jgi:cell division septal protein FtsQ